METFYAIIGFISLLLFFLCMVRTLFLWLPRWMIGAVRATHFWKANRNPLELSAEFRYALIGTFLSAAGVFLGLGVWTFGLRQELIDLKKRQRILLENVVLEFTIINKPILRFIRNREFKGGFTPQVYSELISLQLEKAISSELLDDPVVTAQLQVILQMNRAVNRKMQKFPGVWTRSQWQEMMEAGNATWDNYDEFEKNINAYYYKSYGIDSRLEILAAQRIKSVGDFPNNRGQDPERTPPAGGP